MSILSGSKVMFVKNAVKLVVVIALAVTGLSRSADAQSCTPAGANNTALKAKLSIVGGFNVNLATGIVQVTVKNNAAVGTCPIPVGIATYKKFDNQTLDTQVIYDYYNTSTNGNNLEAGNTVTFTTTLPDCASQIDVFVGDAIEKFSSGNYYYSSDRLIGFYHTNTSNNSYDGTQLSSPALCAYPTATPTSSPTTCPCHMTPTATPTATATSTPTAVNTPPPPTPTCTPTSTNTPVPTATRTATPTSTPVVTVTAVGNQNPTCDAGGPYTAGLTCSSTPVSTTLDGSKSVSNNEGGLTYAWTTTCTDGTISDATASNPSLSVVTLGSNGQPISCKVQLTVTNSQNLSSSCEAEVAGSVCTLDCNGTVNGTATPDSCGICGGDGRSCLGCNTVDIKGTQFVFDTSAAAIRNRVFSLNRIYESLVKAKKNSKLLASARKEIAKDNAKATSGYQTVWTTTYTAFPPVIASCTSTLCVSVSTTNSKNTISSGLETLRKLTESVQKKIVKLVANNKKLATTASKAKKLVSEAKTLESNSLTSLKKVPSTSSSCN